MDTKTSTSTQTVIRTKAEYIALRDALEHYYGNLLGLSETKNIDGQWTDAAGIFRWKDKTQFLNRITETLDIYISPENINRDLADKIYVELTNLEIKAPKTVEFKEAEASPVNATIANEEVRDSAAIKKTEENEAKVKELNQRIKADTEATIARKQEIAEQNRVEDITTQPVYVSNTTEQIQSNQQNVNNAKKLKDFQDIILQKQNEIKSEVEQAKITTEQLKNAPDKKVWVRVIKDPAGDNLYKETVTTLSPGLITNEIIKTPGVLNNVVPNKNSQTIIEKANLEFTNTKLAQYDLYRQILSKQSQPDQGLNNIANIKVEVSETPQTLESGFIEVNATQLFEDQVSSHVESLQSQNETLNDLSGHVKDYGIDSGKSFLLEKAGNKLASHMATLPGDNFARQAYESKFGQFALSQAGLVAPTQYAALTDSFTGDLIVASGYGEIGGFIQSTTGLKLGLIEVGPNGVDMFAPGVIGGITAVGVKAWAAQTTVTYTSLQSSGGQFAAEAFGGGAMQSAVTKTVVTTGKQSLNIALGTAVAKGASSLALKLGFTAASAKIGAAIGTGIIPVIGTIAGAVIGAVFGKLIEKYGPQISRFLDKNKELLIVGGALIFSSFPAIGAVAMLAGGASAIASGGITFGGLTASVLSFFAMIGSFLVFRVGLPLIIGLTSFLLLVVFSVFIINNSAYVTPQGIDLTGLGYNEDGTVSGLDALISGSGIQNPYIGITKTADKPGPFKNSDLNPLIIRFTITITAKKEDLTNVSIKDVCTAISENGQKPCGATQDFSSGVPEGTIKVGSPLVFKYDKVFDKSYADSIITNTVTISANVVSSSSQQTATAVNNITIGKPPISCPLLNGYAATPELNYSYNGQNNTGHGSKRYWGTGMAYYPIPQGSGCMSPSNCSYYGYAYDIFSSSNIVYAPTVLGKQTSWNCTYAFPNDSGRVGHTYHCISTDSNYLLVLTHMNKNVSSGTINSGDKIGTLFDQGGNTHLHMEFQANGQYVKPETYFCGGK